MMCLSSIPDIMVTQEAAKFITDLGYPIYIVSFLGVAKLLGVIAILIPGFPRIKEWAYAGLAFDLIGATYSIISKSGFVAQEGFMLLPLLLLMLSYIYYHKKIAA